MYPPVSRQLLRRRPGNGAFFDYVCEATREQARHLTAQRARIARKERRLAEDLLTSAEQRWEGEGGNTRLQTPGGPA